VSPGPTADDIDALVGLDRYLTALGLHAEQRDDGVVLVLPPLDRHVAIPGPDSLHGGVIAAFLEATASLLLRASTGGDVRTVEFTSDFLRPAPLAPTCAQAVVIRHGRRFASVRVDAWQGDRERPVAAGYGRFVIATV
jgi:uncharacterized protein (TIGR00369 family)